MVEISNEKFSLMSINNMQ